MRLNFSHAPSRLHIPEPNRLIKGSRDDQIRLGVEVDAEDEGGVAAEDLDAFEGGGSDVPDAESAVIRSRADVVGIGGPSEIGDTLGVAGEGGEEGEG